MRSTRQRRTAEAVMNNLDSFIYRIRAQTSRDPLTLTVHRAQAEALIRWAEARSLPQDKVTLRPDGSLEKYKGIDVRVVP